MHTVAVEDLRTADKYSGGSMDSEDVVEGTAYVVAVVAAPAVVETSDQDDSAEFPQSYSPRVGSLY